MQLLQILGEQGVDVLTPEKVKQQLAATQTSGTALANNSLWADHLLMGEATTAGNKTLVSLRLIKVATGEVVSAVTAYGGMAVTESSLDAQTVRGAVERLADALHYEMGKLPGNARYQKVAVMPLEENGKAATNLALGTYLQQEVSMAVKERGYLTVERTRLNEAIAQIGLAQALSADNAPATGKMLGAQLLIVGSVSDVGDRFVITSRVLDAQQGSLLGVAEVKVKRTNVVTLASGAIDTRNVGGAIFRSVILPGWGHYYYQKPIRGVMWSVAAYGSGLTALGLYGAAYSQQETYQSLVPNENDSGEKTQANLAAARAEANNIYTASAIIAGLTGVLWLSNVMDAYFVASNTE